MRDESPRNGHGYRLHLERLEGRLPPGDVLRGVLIGVAASPENVIVETTQDRASSFILGLETAQPGLGSLLILQGPEAASGITAQRLPKSSVGPEVRALVDEWHALAAPDAIGMRVSANVASTWYSAQNARIDFGSFMSAITGSSSGPALSVSAAPSSSELRPSVNHSPMQKPTTASVDRSNVVEKYGNLPLSFEANHGQTNSRVDFIARTGNGTVFLTSTAAVLSFPKAGSGAAIAERELPSQSAPKQVGALETVTGLALRMNIVGANPDAQPSGVGRRPGIVNYFVGNDPNQWHANIPTFAGVQYDDVYPGIDLVYYGNNGQLEYDFVVEPGSDPNAIALSFAGAEGIDIDSQGNLVMHTSAGNLVQKAPYLYQEISGTRLQVTGEFKIQKSECGDMAATCHTAVTFGIGSYDATRPLVIDPLVLGYSTLLGGGGADDVAHDIAVDDAGNAYVAGSTGSAKFPVTPGAFDTSYDGGTDAFVAKLNATGTALIYATYLGGTAAPHDLEEALGIALDDSGNAYVEGPTWSGDFPTTPGAFRDCQGPGDAFVAKLNPDGSDLVYSTCLGTPGGTAIAVDGAGNAYVCGDIGFTFLRYVFVVKMSPDGSEQLYASFFGDPEDQNHCGGIAVDNDGFAYFTGYGSASFPTTPGAYDPTNNGGSDAFVSKLSPDGSNLVYSTFLGGSANDDATGIAIDASGNAYVTGQTQSADFPTTPGAFDTTYVHKDAFIAKVNADGSNLGYSTYVGGADNDYGYGISVDSAGYAYATGITASSDFPTTPFTFDKTYNGNSDAFVTKLNQAGSSLVYSTFLGGSGFPGDFGSRVAVDASGNVYVAGQTYSSDFPTTPGALKRRNRGSADAFVTKFSEM